PPTTPGDPSPAASPPAPPSEFHAQAHAGTLPKELLMSRPQDSRLPYLPGIDALRALAVLAVFFYHASVGWMPGGFLGVDVFFAISGYLITSLLLSERRRTGKVRLGQFWLRRARRLLPAVGVLIAVTMVVAAIVEPGRLTELRGDAIASLAYFANWHF